MRRAVFVDRDGVVNAAVVREGKPYPPSSFGDFRLLDGAGEAMRALRDSGLVVVVVTNQPDVATGKQKREIVEAMNQRLLDDLLCDDVRVCYHTDEDRCLCRKPAPGMLIDAARCWNIDLRQSYMVGDRWRDVAAGRAAGCVTYFIDYGYRERRPDRPDFVVRSLAEATNSILGGQKGQATAQGRESLEDSKS